MEHRHQRKRESSTETGMSILNFNLANIHYEVCGTGPCVIAIHGFTGDTTTWSSFVSSAKQRYTIVSVDLLGHGLSTSPNDPDRYTIDKLVADLENLLNYLGQKRAHWMGYSFGGRISLYAATRIQDRFLSLILESASPGISDPHTRANRKANDDKLANSIQKGSVEQFVDYWEGLPLFSTHNDLPLIQKQSLRNQRLRNNPVGLANSLRGSGTGVQPSVFGKLHNIDLPVLCIVGAKDNKFLRIANIMNSRFKTSRVHTIPSSGHTPHLEQPTQFNKTVLGFLDSLEDSKETNMLPGGQTLSKFNFSFGKKGDNEK